MNNYQNIIIYNGEGITDINKKYNTTRSIQNLFNSCKSIYDNKIIKSQNCIWYILSKNIPENMIVTIIENVISKAINCTILKDELIRNPFILQNVIVPISTITYTTTSSIIELPIITNSLYNIADMIITTQFNSYIDSFDILE